MVTVTLPPGVTQGEEKERVALWVDALDTLGRPTKSAERTVARATKMATRTGVW